MKITVAYNLRTEENEEQAELLLEEDVDRICNTLSELRHKVSPVEVSGNPQDVVERLLESEPDLIFNVAEGYIGSSREAFYPGLYEQLGIPFTGGNASLLHMNLDKNLAKTVVASRGIKVPRGILVTSMKDRIPDDLEYPLIIKPNSEGSSKGITQDSVVENPKKCRKRIESLLGVYPAGLIVEEFIEGRELSVPLLERYPGKILEIVEHTFDLQKNGLKYNIYDFDMKQQGEKAAGVNVECPAKLSSEERDVILDMAKKVFTIMTCPDFGRVDIRLRNDNVPFFIEMNPLPCLHPNASLMKAAKASGLDFKQVLRLIVLSAARRYNLPLRTPSISLKERDIFEGERPTARDVGIKIGRFSTGSYNAITDVKGVKVGHVTHIEDNIKIPGVKGESSIRTGVTAILPAAGQIFKNHHVAGGFILNGAGEMSGLTQVLEWGWLETPILLTNSLSVGKVHSGVISYVRKKYPHMGMETDVILPVVGEADDSFLNDVRVGVNTPQDAVKAIESAKSGRVQQGSVGAGTGMISFDFAGGIGTSSRTVMLEEGGFTLGVLVLSNFGKMRNLTIDGCVVGRDLVTESSFNPEDRRKRNYGSTVVVIATDAPLISGQLCRISRRAALGLGRAGSYAAYTSGEIVISFTTANSLPRSARKPSKFLKLRFIADMHIDPLYEAAIEATEEAVINAMFCSGGMKGRNDRFCPAIPQDKILQILKNGRNLNDRNQE